MGVPTKTEKQLLPSFEEPPVVEVICGLTFKPLDGLLAPHLGILWEKFRSDYPVCKQVEPLIPVIETFDGGEINLGSFTLPLLPRIWFVSKDQNGIIQVQRDRFLHNWRKVRPTDEYPRYGTVIEKFRKARSVFDSFLKENDLGTIVPVQFEMSYVNHIPQGPGWQSTKDISHIFPDFSWRNGTRFLNEPEKINWSTSFLLPDQSARLHIAIQLAARRQDRLPVLVLELTVRGIGPDTSPEGSQSWFDTAREWIVRGFADITGDDIQQRIWKRVS